MQTSSIYINPVSNDIENTNSSHFSYQSYRSKFLNTITNLILDPDFERTEEWIYNKLPTKIHSNSCNFNKLKNQSYLSVRKQKILAAKFKQLNYQKQLFIKNKKSIYIKRKCSYERYTARDYKQHTYLEL